MPAPAPPLRPAAALRTTRIDPASPHAASQDEIAVAAGYAVGIDIGGTNTKLGLVDPNGQIVVREKVKTASLEQPRNACESFRAFAAAALAEASVEPQEPIAVGVAVPGILDARTGLLEYVANLPEWREFPLRQTLQSIFEGPVAVANDANAAAFAEYARRQLTDESLALLTLGTGIGCGVVVNGHPYHGDHGCGFEVGHVPVAFGPDARMCGCDKPGHVEAYVGRSGVLRTAGELIETQGLTERLAELTDGGRKRLSPRHLAQAAESGDAIAGETIDRTADWVGVAAAILCQTLDPSYILIGGAMTFGGRGSDVGRRFLDRVIESNARVSLDSVAKRVVIDFASLGNDAGICGICELARLGAPARVAQRPKVAAG